MSKQPSFSRYLAQASQTALNILLFRLNGLLTWAADILDSETFDLWRMQYGNWYNLRLLRRFLDREVLVEESLVTFHVTTMETIGKIIIAKLNFSGCTKNEAIKYVEESMTVFLPATIDSLQSSIIDHHHLKFTFSL